MKPSHNPDAKAYHEYYLNQAGRGYPVYVGTRYQRGHGLGSIFGSLLKSAVPLLKKGATNPIPISYIRKSFGVLEPFLTEDVFRCVPYLRLTTSGLFPLCSS
jgi:hypothetical protein